MVDFPSAVAVPSTAAYAPPRLDFSWLADLPNRYYQGKTNAFNSRQQQRTENLQKPIDATDTASVLKEVLQRGGAPYAEALLPFMLHQEQMKAASQPDPMLSGVAPQGQQPTGNPPPASVSGAVPTQMKTPVGPQSGDPGTGTITDLVTAQYGQTADAGRLMARVSMTMGIDPNAPLSKGQQLRAFGLMKRYAGDTTSAPNGSGISVTAPSPLPNAAQPPVGHVADAFSTVPGATQPSVPTRTGAVVPQPQPARPQMPPQAPPSPPPAAAAALPAASAPTQGNAPQLPQAPQNGAPGPIGPQFPLPPGFKPGQEPQAIMALREHAMELSSSPNKYLQHRAPFFDQWANELEKSTQPIIKSVGGDIVDIRSGRKLYEGGGLFSPEDARLAALRLFQGDNTALQGLGRGAQRAQNIKLVYDQIRDLGAEKGLSEDQVAKALTEARAAFAGQMSYQRSGGTYGMRVAAAAQEVEQALPLAVESSRNLPRGEWVPWNKLVQAWQQGTSNPAYNDFVVKNFSLINAYTRAMNPTGQPRITERLEQKADNILSKATSPQAYEVQARALWQEVTRSEQAIAKARAGEVDPNAAFPEIPGSGSNASGAQGESVQHWVRKPDGSLGPAQ